MGYYPIPFYTRRLTAIAKRKKAHAIYGNHHAGRRPGLVGFSVRGSIFVMLAHGLLRWWKAELANAWTYVVKPARMAEPVAVMPPLEKPQSASVDSSRAV